MAPLPPAPGVLKVVLSGTIAGAPFANVFHFRYTGGPPTSAQLGTAIGTTGSGIFDRWRFRFGSVMPSDVILQQVEIQDLTSSTSASAIGAGVQAGLGSAPIPISSACVLTSWKIGRRYRGGHPRTYWPGFGTTELFDPRHWKAATVASLDGQVFPFMADIEAGLVSAGAVSAAVFGNLSYFSGNAVRVAPVFDDITSSFTSTEIATQRRRLDR